MMETDYVCWVCGGELCFDASTFHFRHLAKFATHDPVVTKVQVIVGIIH